MTAILGATLQVLEDAGLAGVTTTRVAGVAGVSVGTLYQYFPNRDALVTALLADHLEHAIGALEGAVAAGAGIEGAVRAFLAAKAARAHAARVMSQAFAVDRLDDRPIVRAAYARAHAAVSQLLPGAPAERARRATLACSALEGIVRSAILEDPERLRDDDWVARVVQIARAF